MPFPQWLSCPFPVLTFFSAGPANVLAYPPAFHIRNQFHLHGLLIILMIVAPTTPETLADFYQTAWYNNTEDSHLQ
jgi:hypothetical protein